MTRRIRMFGRPAPLATLAALAVVGLGGTALAGHVTSDVKSYTGCLVPGDGVVIKVKEGNAPARPCTGGMTQVHLSGGDITRISVAGALTGGGDNGEVTIGLKPEFTLPTGCAAGQVAEWSGTGWACAADDNSIYEPGTGLELVGTTVFRVAPDYRVKNAPDCASGQFATGFAPDGTIQCGTPTTGGVHAYSAHVGATTVAGDTVVVSKTLPAGTYLLFATVALVNQDGDGAGDEVAAAECRIPGYSTGTQGLLWDSDFGTADTKETAALSSAIVHAGGAVELRCEEKAANVDVFGATLTAIKVDSLG